jgi:hypothetical protein
MNVPHVGQTQTCPASQAINAIKQIECEEIQPARSVDHWMILMDQSIGRSMPRSETPCSRCAMEGERLVLNVLARADEE